MQDTRNNFVIGMIGANHTGKSTKTRKIIEDWRASRSALYLPGQRDKNGRALWLCPVGIRPEPGQPQVVAYDEKQQFKGLVNQFIYPGKDWATAVFRTVRNSLIVLDDYKGLIPEYVATGPIRDLFIARWHYNNDFIYSCHGPSHINDMLIDYTNIYYIYHTKSAEGKFNEKMPNSKKFIDCSKIINHYTSIYGLGKHPNDPQFAGQHFPYLKFNTVTQQIDGYNIRPDFKF